VALRYRVLLAMAAAVPLVPATACSAAGGGNGDSGGSATAASVSGPGSSGGAIPLTPATPQTLTETGSTLLLPLMDAWAGAYHQRHPSVSFTTAGTGSAAGITDASAGKVRIGASDADLSSGDLVTDPSLLNVPLAISAQQVNYNVPGLAPGVHLRLDGAVLAQMYQGTIACRTPRRFRCWPGRSRSAGCCCARPTRTPIAGSPRRATWPSS
jgi:phosphate transport system substrate-binding protein